MENPQKCRREQWKKAEKKEKKQLTGEKAYNIIKQYDERRNRLLQSPGGI